MIVSINVRVTVEVKNSIFIKMRVKLDKTIDNTIFWFTFGINWELSEVALIGLIFLHQYTKITIWLSSDDGNEFYKTVINFIQHWLFEFLVISLYNCVYISIVSRDRGIFKDHTRRVRLSVKQTNIRNLYKNTCGKLS